MHWLFCLWGVTLAGVLGVPAAVLGLHLACGVRLGVTLMASCQASRCCPRGMLQSLCLSPALWNGSFGPLFLSPRRPLGVGTSQQCGRTHGPHITIVGLAVEDQMVQCSDPRRWSWRPPEPRPGVGLAGGGGIQHWGSPSGPRACKACAPVSRLSPRARIPRNSSCSFFHSCSLRAWYRA